MARKNEDYWLDWLDKKPFTTGQKVFKKRFSENALPDTGLNDCLSFRFWDLVVVNEAFDIAAVSGFV